MFGRESWLADRCWFSDRLKSHAGETNPGKRSRAIGSSIRLSDSSPDARLVQHSVNVIFRRARLAITHRVGGFIIDE